MKYSHSTGVRNTAVNNKPGNMNVFIYGKSVSGSRYVGNRKKRKIHNKRKK